MFTENISSFGFPPGYKIPKKVSQVRNFWKLILNVMICKFVYYFSLQCQQDMSAGKTLDFLAGSVVFLIPNFKFCSLVNFSQIQFVSIILVLMVIWACCRVFCTKSNYNCVSKCEIADLVGISVLEERLKRTIYVNLVTIKRTIYGNLLTIKRTIHGNLLTIKRIIYGRALFHSYITIVGKNKALLEKLIIH